MVAGMRSGYGRQDHRVWILAGWFAVFLSLGAATMELGPVADAGLMELEPDFNLGAQEDVPVGGLGALAANTVSRMLIRFDLSGVPAGAVFQSARLRCEVVREPSGAVDSTFALHRVLVPWEEGGGEGPIPGGVWGEVGEVTWGERVVGGGLWGEPGGRMGEDYSGVISATEQVTGVGVYEIELRLAGLEDLADWVADPALNFGWVLLSQEEGVPKTARRFATREAVSGAPRLFLEYVVAGGGPRVEGVRLEGGEFRCRFWAEAGVAYVWEVGLDIAGGMWEEVERVPLQPVAGWVQFTNAVAGGGAHFYRLRVAE